MPTMMARTTATANDTLLLALDLGNRTWKLGFTVGGGALPPRIRTMGARDLPALAHELRAAKARFALAREAPVVSCYEAGRDGFWVHRALTSLGVTNVVVDSASIEGTRRARQAKSDRLDTAALLAKLGRFHGGERGVWSVVSVPSVDDEDRRQLHRELFTITRERTRVVQSHQSVARAPRRPSGYATRLARDAAGVSRTGRVEWDALLARAVNTGFYPHAFIAEFCPYLASVRGTQGFAAVLEDARRRSDAFVI